MSYCVEYNPELNIKYPKPKIKKSFPTKKLIYLLVFFVASYIFMQGKLYRYLLPGNPDVTISAFSTMVESVGEGDSVKDAVVAFCQEIILNGNQ